MNKWSMNLMTYLSQKYPTNEENIKGTKELLLDYHFIKEINKEIIMQIILFR